MLLGLDIGGTKIAGVLLDDAGVVVDRSWVTHAARGPEAVADALAVAARPLLGHSPTRPVLGVSISGLVAQSGIVSHAALLEVYDDDLATRLSDRLELAAMIVNDADATLVAAAADGPDAPVADAVLLTLGTGVGGAVLSGGRLLQGPTGYAGELGHLPIVDPLDHPCVCGSSGCLEQLAGGRGLAERLRRLPEAAALAGQVGVPIEELSSVHVVEAARTGHPASVRLVSEAAQAVGHALALLTVTVEPSVIFLGGSLAHAAADLLIPEAGARLARQLPFAGVRRPPPIRLDDLGPTAAAIGAARLAGSRRPASPPAPAPRTQGDVRV